MAGEKDTLSTLEAHLCEQDINDDVNVPQKHSLADAVYPTLTPVFIIAHPRPHF
jgi:hypothetical protein